MASKEWQSKGQKTVRQSPRQGKRQCARPFKAPRSVTTKDKEVELISETFIDVISETENARDIEARQDKEPHVIPFIKGIQLLSEREADECAEHGEVLRWSHDSDVEETKDQTPENITSDTTGSTPEIFKSPDLVQDRVSGSNGNDTSLGEETVVAKTVPPRKYKGWVYIPESEAKENSSDSEDNVPVTSLLKPKTLTSPYLEELQDYKEGPEGERVVGKTVAKYLTV